MDKESMVEISPEDIFGLIALSGDAKASYHSALYLLRENKIDEAEAEVAKGHSMLYEAHAIQTKFITLEAQGKSAQVGVLMVHAQDHLMNTILVKELLDHMMNMQKEINLLKGMN
ncbi:cellobiose-specific phosphotransferase system component IIA [Bacillus ectoiniformans]|uniref:PTS lactose/cellobiose transporter subunit IIA n=1 Tax=Bacillus ectoiniformans TaxID=1494429 RepID=UPI00195A8153|nr:PTS lactose/cellobiose transporter subunit IIA [Bacillus ectoiniformans]MBM7650409.1 cellobiose-specific phosphotransferase system component IIA [Bacillus ectoiniformans]